MSRFSQRIQEKKLLYRVMSKKDPDAFAELYDTYIEQIYRFVYLKVNNTADAEDLCSDIFLKTWEVLSKKKVNEITHFRGFLYTIARNCIIDLYRQRAKQNERPIEEGEHISDQTDIDAHIDAKEEKKILLAQIQRLKQEYQEVIVLRYIDEYSISEIAEIMGKKKVNVRVLLHRATKKLEGLMNKR